MATKVNFLAGIYALHEHLSVILAIKLRISHLSTTVPRFRGTAASDVSPSLPSIADLYRSRLTMNGVRRAYRRSMLQRGAA